MTEENSDRRRSWIDEIEVASEKLIERIKELASDASVQRLRVKDKDGDIAVDIPLTIGAPTLAVLGVLAAFAARVKVEVIRDPDVAEAAMEEPKADDNAE
jgi:uncharacterized membrane protein YdfJ with MMPL/SSD domain